jgi:hypothetical protein
VTWTVPGSGASETLSSLTVTIGAGGVVSVKATANGTTGMYGITMTASGIATPASFSMTNTSGSSYTPVFSRLTNQTITYGTATEMFAGTIADGANIPSGYEVAITLNSVEQDATVGGDGSFSSTFTTNPLKVAGSVYTVSYGFTAPGEL